MGTQINNFMKGMMSTTPETEPNQFFTDGINGRLNYNGRELAFTNKDGTLLISAPSSFYIEAEEVVGHYSFEDELILFAKREESPNGSVWSVKETATENEYTFNKIHEGDYNFPEGVKLVCRGVFENEHFKRVYFTDGVNPLRTINVLEEDLINMPISRTPLFQEAELPAPTITGFGAGSVKAMNVQYVYRLVSSSGSVSAFSRFTLMQSVMANYTTVEKDTAVLAGESTGSSVEVAINLKQDAVDSFQVIECYAVCYEAKNSVTSVVTLGIRDVATENLFIHSGGEPDANFSIDSVFVPGGANFFKTCKELEIIDNLLLVADMTYDGSEEENTFDPLIKQYDHAGNTWEGKYNPDPKQYLFDKTWNPSYSDDRFDWIVGGESEGYKNGNGIRVSFRTFKNRLSYTNGPRGNVNEIRPNMSSLDAYGVSPSEDKSRYNPADASYQREEVYRFAIRFNSKGKESFVRYIGDFRIPSIDLYEAYYSGHESEVAPATPRTRYKISSSGGSGAKLHDGINLYPVFDVKLPKSITDKYDSYDILRVKRGPDDRTVIDQGLAYPMQKEVWTNPSDSAKARGYTLKRGSTASIGNCYRFCAGMYNPTDQNTNSGSDKSLKIGPFEHRPHLGLPYANYDHQNHVSSFDSPMTVSGMEDYSLNGTVRYQPMAKVFCLDYNFINGSFGKRAQDHGYWNYYRHVFFTHVGVDDGLLINRNEALLTAGKDVDQNIIKNYAFANPMDSVSIGTDRPVLNLGLTTFSGNSTVGNSYYHTEQRENKCKTSTAERTLILRSHFPCGKGSSVGTWSDDKFLYGIKTYGTNGHFTPFEPVHSANNHDWPFWVGQSVVLNSLVISLVRDLDKQYGGRTDYAISNNTFIKCHTEDISKGEDIGNDIKYYSSVVKNGDIYVDLFHHKKFHKEESPNLDTPGGGKEAYHDSLSGSFSVVLETHISQLHSKGKKLIKGVVDEVNSDVYIYNDAYESESNKTSITKPFNFKEVTSFPNQIQVSDLKINGDIYDSWSIFQTSNFHELELNNGRITNLINHKGNLYATQSNEGLYRIYINPRAIVQSQDGRSISIGQGDIVNIEDSDQISIHGTSFNKSVVISDEGFMFFNDKHRKVIMVTNGVAEISDITFNQSKIYDELKGKQINDVSAYYSERFSEMVLCVNYDTDKYMAICYNNSPLFNLFNGTSDAVSNMYIKFRDKIIARHNSNKLYLLDEGEKGNFFGTVKDTELEFVVNPNIEDVKIFDNFMGIIESNGVKFKEIRFYTNLNEEQVIYGDDYRYKIREGRHIVPLREQQGKPRMRGDYMKIRIIFDNSNNKLISIVSVLTQYRKSNR